ncbi:Bug family tripartite tricarboxylate transporter substrate binding protein [Bordetella genomosp. 13]|uniref:Bug family tripartite tricarboxylate transporter substrate binding protein n=1 Tax=Bordetella genomosp. 13 TaxID=463040 RepID=UPI0011A17256|nr:tripartite tricarboxylate transporter substrate binding protein [Bordetella genomosp. 13]
MFKRSLAALAAAGTLFGATPAAVAKDFPSEPIRLIIPFAPGGTADIVGRLFAQKLGQKLDGNVVVENKAGAAGVIGSRFVAEAKPDGHTLLLASSSTHAANPAIYAKLPYDALADFTPITQIVSVPGVLSVNDDVKAATLADLVADSRAHPTQYTYASSGAGTLGNLAMELFKKNSGAEILHVAYKGAGPAFNDVIGRQVSMIWEPLPSSLPFIKSGRLRALAVASSQRLPEIPDVPTFVEAGIGSYDVSAWNGLLGPKGMPADLTDRIQKAAVEALKDPELQQRFKELGGTVVGNTPDQFRTVMGSEIAKWKDVAAAANIKLD